MRASRSLRTAGAWGHLLLVAALALGVFLMHTVGHPDGSSSGGTAAHGSGSTTASATGHGSVTPAAPASFGPHGPERAAALPADTEHDGAPSSHGSGMAMDLASLCVAVLAAWVLAALVAAALRRRTEWLVRLRTGALRSLLPLPPPRSPDLLQLSVLRI
ncbi:hypothetical protein [Streptomyces sp. NPDC059816]|uniref:hypothetical protein n=1 Tax=Streptomyces sp. NPDC059816 TaxID=3346960 RepID=UPI00365AEB2E